MTNFSGTEEFFFKGNDEAILLIHGYTGAPGEMRLLGEYLHKQGFSVCGVRLKGHGTTPQELNDTNWSDWYESVQIAMQELKKAYNKIYVIGLSMGGLLAIKTTVDFEINKLVLISTPIFIYDKRLPYLKILKYFIPYLKKRKRHYQVNAEYSYCYEVMPVRPLVSLFQLIKLCKNIFLEKINVPSLILQSEIEHTVKPISAKYIYNKLSSKDKELVFYKKSGHILTLDIEHDIVFEKIFKFLQR